MKKLIAVLIVLTSCYTLTAGEITVKRVKGTAEVRHGVSEAWAKLNVGVSLGPESTIKTGKNSSLTILVEDRKVIISERTMMDLADLREMSQEELLLKLAEADVRVAPSRDGSDETPIPNTTVVHGRNMAVPEITTSNQNDIREMEVRGTKLLYSYGFFPTCILKAKQTMLYYPDLKSRFEFRSMIGQALEKMGLTGEALGEYISITKEKLSPPQRKTVEGNIRRLKQG
ncbi:MAG: hypothetical protein WBW16_03500 [Bacteroidota bacterium]